MTVNRGKEDVFVVMNICFNKHGSVKIGISDYILECISSYGKHLNGGTTTPVKKYLFDIDESSEQLSKDRKELFHHIVAKLLFVSKRARPDIDLTISFLCSRVDKSTEEDWNKLGRLLHIFLSKTYRKGKRFKLSIGGRKG